MKFRRAKAGSYPPDNPSEIPTTPLEGLYLAIEGHRVAKLDVFHAGIAVSLEQNQTCKLMQNGVSRQVEEEDCP